MKKFFFISILFFVFISSISYASVQNYRNENHGLEISIPEKWNITEGDQQLVMMATSPLDENDTKQENVVLIGEALPQNLGLKEYVDVSLENLSQVSNMSEGFLQTVEILDREKVIINDIPMEKLTISSFAQNEVLRQVQYIFLKDNIGYVVVFTASKESMPQYQKEFETIINSMKYISDRKETQVYQNEEHNFSLEIPFNWQGVENYMDTVFAAISPPNSLENPYRRNVTIATEELPSTIPLKEYAELNQKNIAEAFNEYVLESKESTTLKNGIKAVKSIYSVKTEEIETKHLMYIFVHDKQGFAISGTINKENFKEYQSEIEEIINTFKFNE
ncbi:MAG: PsbP-related protein [bacterium]